MMNVSIRIRACLGMPHAALARRSLRARLLAPARLLRARTVAFRAAGLRAGGVALALALARILALTVLVVLVDVGLLGPPAAGLEGEHAGERDGADEVRGRELERRPAEGRGELGRGRAGGRGGRREGERERGEVRGEVCVGLDRALG